MKHARIPPPGSRYVPDWYIARPFEEESALGYLEFGDPVLLWGPRDQGCTWLCQHLVRRWQQGGAARTYLIVDFRGVGASGLESLDACLGEVARILDEALPPDPERVPIAERWPKMRGDAKTRLTSFMWRTVLPAMPGELLIAFDHADLVHSRPFYEDIAGLLRSWAEKSKDTHGLPAGRGDPRAVWRQLRLLVSVSVHPARLRTARYESPFVNLSDPIQVGDLEIEQVSELVARHGLDWTRADVERLMTLVGGHPYLVRAVLEDIRHGRYGLADLQDFGEVGAAGAITPGGGARAAGRSLIDEYLRRDRTRLEAAPELGAAFEQLVEDPRASVAPSALDDLIRLGLVGQGPGGSHPVRYRLFQRLRYAASTCAAAPRKQRLFYSYAHADEDRRDRLELHLSLLQRQGVIAPWHDRRVAPGSDRRADIDEHLERADIILLLISADFLASDYCWGRETQRAMARHAAGEARVVPIILRACDWHSAPFGDLQALPKDTLPVSRWSDEDDAWADIATAIRGLVAP
ncbi:MAG: hypothetical protein Tsb0020_38350 [Haliangiales bacterium]